MLQVSRMCASSPKSPSAWTSCANTYVPGWSAGFRAGASARDKEIATRLRGDYELVASCSPNHYPALTVDFLCVGHGQVESIFEKQGHCVVCVAEGAGQDLLTVRGYGLGPG